MVDLDAARGAPTPGRRRSARRLERALLGAHRRGVRARPHRREPGRGPDLRLHAARSRRQDPDGLLLAVRDGEPRRDEGPVRPRLRERRRLGPARDRDPVARAHEPQPLPGGRDRLALPEPPRLAGGDGDRQDARLVRRSSTGWRRGWGGKLVEVPVGFKWFVPGLLDGTMGFGGEESAGASFLRRDGTVWTTDKDGIVMDLLALEMRARSRQGPGRAVPRARRRARRAGLRARRRAGDPGGEGRPQEALAGGGPRHRRWPASPSSRGSPARPATARRSAGSRWSPPNGLVRRAPVRDRGRLQDLRGELSRRGATSAGSSTRRRRSSPPR